VLHSAAKYQKARTDMFVHQNEEISSKLISIRECL